jgi:alginate O-acetyltransferase complex protein AlgJ
LKKALDGTREEKFELTNVRRLHSKARDLVDQLPPNPPTFALEQVTPMKVSKAQAAKEDLLGNRASSGLTLVGSSYSNAWTGFPDALRYTLQRDLLSVSVGADQGSWIGMESYLSDDSFQTQKPKLLIWEMPERDMRAPPDFKFRDARYVINNTEWLLRASAWVQTSCKPSAVTAKLAPVGLTASATNMKGADLATGPTNDNDFAEIVFDKPIEKLDYLAVRATAAGSKTVTLEASGAGVAARRFSVSVPGDDIAHALKAPLPSTGNGFTKVRIYPGKSNSFALQGLQVCRQPEDLLR